MTCENCCCLGELSLTGFVKWVWKWCTLNQASRKTELGYLNCISRVGQRIYRMSVYSVVLMGIVYRLRCWHAAWYPHLLTGDLCPTCCAAESAVPHFLFVLSSATYAELIWRRKGRFVRMMKNSLYSFKSMFSFGNSNAKEHIWK